MEDICQGEYVVMKTARLEPERNVEAQLPFFAIDVKTGCYTSRFDRDSPCFRAVSYTHLDVYKRQV